MLNKVYAILEPPSLFSDHNGINLFMKIYSNFSLYNFKTQKPVTDERFGKFLANSQIFFQIFSTDKIAISTSEFFWTNFGFSLPSLGHALSAPRAQNAHLPRVPNQMVPSVYIMGWQFFLKDHIFNIFFKINKKHSLKTI